MKTEKARNNMIKKLWNMVAKEDVNNAFSLCLDWNSKHPNNEVFMAEDWDEDGYKVYVEDDYIIISEE